MGLWTETEFQRVALLTRLAERTVAACRDVLVDGVPGVEAAARWKIFPAQLSRGVGVLKKKQDQLVESATSLEKDDNLLKYTVAQIAKCMMGEKFNVIDAQPGNSYVGPVILNSHGFVVQRVGIHGISHDVGSFEEVPRVNSHLSIIYPKESGRPLVSSAEINPDFTDHRALSLGRRSDDRGL